MRSKSFKQMTTTAVFILSVLKLQLGKLKEKVQIQFYNTDLNSYLIHLTTLDVNFMTKYLQEKLWHN